MGLFSEVYRYTLAGFNQDDLNSNWKFFDFCLCLENVWKEQVL